MKFKMDQTVHALYVEIHEGAVANTIEIENGIYADVDHKGTVLGVEFVNADDFTRFLGNPEHANQFVQLEDLVMEELIQA